MAAPPLTSRPLDLLYFVFFLIHIPISLAIDFQQVYPPAWIPDVLKSVAQWYLSEHGDPIYAGGMGLLRTKSYEVVWLKSFTYIEMFFQFPTFFIGAWALYKGRREWYPLLIAYGASTATTLVASVAYLIEYPTSSRKSATFETMTADQKFHVLATMGPWIVIPALMAVDMTVRVARILGAAERSSAAKKVQ